MPTAIESDAKGARMTATEPIPPAPADFGAAEPTGATLTPVHERAREKPEGLRGFLLPLLLLELVWIAALLAVVVWLLRL